MSHLKENVNEFAQKGVIKAVAATSCGGAAPSGMITKCDTPLVD